MASVANYFDRYTALVEGGDVSNVFIDQDPALTGFLKKVTEEKANYSYDKGKWTLKEMLQHLIDAERIFCYRALSIARGEQQDLPGFDENNYAAQSDANRRTWQSLADEMRAVRTCTKMLFESFTPSMLSGTGTFNNNSCETKRLAFIITGHVKHHMQVAKEKYGV